MESGWLGWGILLAGFVAVYFYQQRKKARSFGVLVPVAVRVRPRQNWVGIVILIVGFLLFWHFAVDR